MYLGLVVELEAELVSRVTPDFAQDALELPLVWVHEYQVIHVARMCQFLPVTRAAAVHRSEPRQGYVALRGSSIDGNGVQILSLAL